MENGLMIAALPRPRSAGRSVRRPGGEARAELRSAGRCGCRTGALISHLERGRRPKLETAPGDYAYFPTPLVEAFTERPRAALGGWAPGRARVMVGRSGRGGGAVLLPGKGHGSYSPTNDPPRTKRRRRATRFGGDGGALAAGARTDAARPAREGGADAADGPRHPWGVRRWRPGAGLPDDHRRRPSNSAPVMEGVKEGSRLGWSATRPAGRDEARDALAIRGVFRPNKEWR